eukprot:CAMPEP_0174363702 /NCGR_PEP_ID=MMETSP0811_2-20130205/69889_1 /TAXON_ID=73025 ORGANISM="Eutreptiella gymnastica-like, Strain CCMP1594" /NCGR_SAMPLE_ID=MMETSP0811_2 /ASSEMBLY_ACC=CAM_ASM_000667 /LENGTH=345 /DNA_ID=CAMNT_0015502629 /DNA_START=39 /DNA_END=1076 /DNA_ORIENTATION=-
MSEPAAKKAKLSCSAALSFPRHSAPTFPRRRMFNGFFAPTPTPYNDDGSVNLDLIPVLGEKLVADGADGVFINGTAGEGVLLAPADRKAMTEAWVKFAGPKATRKLKIISHVGEENGPATKDLAAHAQAAGVDGIACMSPCIFKPKSVVSLVDWLADIASACPSTPFIYYHCTFLTGPSFRCFDILRACDLAIPNMKGCKFTDRDIGDLATCLQYFPDMDIFPAFDNQLLMSCLLGADAFVSCGVNLIAPMYKACFNLVRAGKLEEAKAVMARIIDFWERCETYSSGVYSKIGHLAKWLVGLKLGGKKFGPPCRPIASMSSDEMKGVDALLRDWGWKDWTVTPTE